MQRSGNNMLRGVLIGLVAGPLLMAVLGAVVGGCSAEREFPASIFVGAMLFGLGLGIPAALLGAIFGAIWGGTSSGSSQSGKQIAEPPTDEEETDSGE